MKYTYAYALTGVLEAPDEETARLRVLMGISLTSFIAATGPDIAIQVAEHTPEEESEEENGSKPKRRRRPSPPRLMEH